MSLLRPDVIKQHQPNQTKPISLIWWVCHPGYQVSVALCDLFLFFLNKLAIVFVVDGPLK